MNNMLEEALSYARKGWFVFPCREKPGAPYVRNGEEVIPGEKTPYTANGLHDATKDEDQIRQWWTIYEDALIGVNAGLSGLFVLDIDKKGVNGLETFSTWNINDSAGLKTITPSGGMHIIFTGKGKTDTNAKTGIDTRGEGGYFIAPPSKILKGKYCGEYRRMGDWTKSPGVIPDGLMSKLFPDITIEYVRGATTGLIQEKKQLSQATLRFMRDGAPQGERNTSLFKTLADFSGCGYSKEEARELVLPVSDRIGLPKGEFETVLDHAYSKPRTSSIPESIQEKIRLGGRDLVTKITFEEQTILEYALLACLLMDNTLIPIIADVLSYEDFQLLENRIIYRVMIRMFMKGMKVDYFTLSSEILKETDKVSTDKIARMIDRYYLNTDNIITYADIIREKSAIRKLEAVLDNKDKYLEEKNFVEMVSSVERDISNVALYGGAKTKSILDANQAINMVREYTQSLINGEIEQLKTGFSLYDSEVGGIFSNELIICAGRAGEGKSSLSLSLLNHISVYNKIPTALFSLEMSTHESICRLICQLTGIPFKNVYQGKLNEVQWDLYRNASHRISESPIYFDEGFGTTVPEIRSKIRKLVEKDVKLVVIDQLEQIKGYDGLPAYVQYDKIAYDIKNLTLEFGIPIILNHQLNRNVTDRKLKNPEPQLADLNQAGEKPANQVWVIVHRKDNKGEILQSKVKVLKNRNGPRIDFPVVYVGERMLFSNPVREEDKHVFYSGEDDYDDYDAHSNAPSWSN